MRSGSSALAWTRRAAFVFPEKRRWPTATKRWAAAANNLRPAKVNRTVRTNHAIKIAANNRANIAANVEIARNALNTGNAVAAVLAAAVVVVVAVVAVIGADVKSAVTDSSAR